MERLRGHLRRHNRQVLGLTVVTFLFAVVLWAGLYFVVWWIVLLGGAAVTSGDYHPLTGPLTRGFVATAVLLCALAWVGRILNPNEVARDHKSIGEHLMDVVLAIPRVTLTLFGMGGAAARLSETELEHAWNLLSRMNEAAQPLPVQTMPVDIPDAGMRGRILMALQLSGVIEIRPSAGGPVLAFRSKEARRLAEERVRIRV